MTLEIGSLARPTHKPDADVGVVVRREADKVTLLVSEHWMPVFKTTALAPVERAAAPEGSFARQLVEREDEALAGVPQRLHAQLRRVWYTGSLGGRRAYLASGGVHAGGRDSQKENAEWLRQNGILEGDPRFEQVRAFGAWLYGMAPSQQRPTRTGAGSAPAPATSPAPVAAPPAPPASDDEPVVFTNDLTSEYLRRSRALEVHFPAACAFLQALERLGGDYHLGTNLNAHLYLGRQYLTYLLIEPRDRPEGADPRLTFRPRPNGAIKRGTYRNESVLFPRPLYTLAQELGGIGAWAKDLGEDGVQLSRDTPAEYFRRVLTAMRDLGSAPRREASAT